MLWREPQDHAEDYWLQFQIKREASTFKCAICNACSVSRTGCCVAITSLLVIDEN